jgi:hypothetical protein
LTVATGDGRRATGNTKRRGGFQTRPSRFAIINEPQKYVGARLASPGLCVANIGNRARQASPLQGVCGVPLVPAPCAVFAKHRYARETYPVTGAKQSSAGRTTYVLRVYVSQTTTSTLDCFAAFHRYVSRVRRRLRKDGQGKALPCPGARRRDGGRGRPLR